MTQKPKIIFLMAIAAALCLTGNAVATYLDISPVDDFEPSGMAGGPFSPSFKEYQLTNVDTSPLYWGLDNTVNWLELVPDWGLLDPCESVIVTVSLNSEANLLSEGIYADTLTFTDITNAEQQIRAVTLSVTPPGELGITPSDDFEPSGGSGGPFTPESKEYQLTNSGGSPINWSAEKTADWLDLDPISGQLDPCESTIVTVSLNSQANLLGDGTYNDTLLFTDITNDEQQSRAVTLSVRSVWISPSIFDFNIVEGGILAETLTIGNDGQEDLDFMLRTRQVGSSGQSEQVPADGSTVMIDAPRGHDFTVAGKAPYKQGELIVRFAPGAHGRGRQTAEKNAILRSAGGGSVKHNFKIVPGLSVVTLPRGMTVEKALKAFNKANGILYAEPDYEVTTCATIPDDARFDELWGMHNTGQSGGTADADIDAPEAWDMATGSGEIVVAVIDTGVDYTHPDLAANMWENEAERDGVPGVDDDGNGYVDDIYGYDFRNHDGDPMDDHYHGTHCAGTIGAVGNNGEGVAGVNWNVRIMAVKFLSSGGSGTTTDAIASVEYSTLMGANLSSNSWGGGGYSQGLKDVIDAAGAAGMLFAAAAGNDNENTDSYPHYPSSYNSESIISVMATDKYDNKSSFSNWGPVSVDLGAPGSNILSCQPGSGYQYLNGTSMATPHVAGACALLWSVNPMMSNSEVKEILLQTVDETLSGLCVSQGRLNLYNAILETKAPWIEMEPEESIIPPGQSADINVIFDAAYLELGTYEAEILVISNDPCGPAIIPVTMTVTADDLQVTPAEGFESIGTEGGPFEPCCVTYTLTNNGDADVNWTTFETESWLEVTPYEGILAPAETIEVNVCISVDANLLDPNIYTDVLTFQNTDSNSIKQRSVSLTVKPPDCFTESFGDGGNDLEGLTVSFMPDGTGNYYEACCRIIDEFPTEPNGGNSVSLWDDSFAEVVLADGKTISFYGTSYDEFFIGSNGYITFGAGDTEFNASLENHFVLPRISGLFADLNPSDAQCISYKQLDDRMAVTFCNIPVYGDKTAISTFQVEMFFASGGIRISWLETAAMACIAGLSEGSGLAPVFFEQSDLTSYPPCWPCGDFDRNYSVDFKDFALLGLHWLESDCGIPYWCGRADLDFSGTTDTADLGIFTENWLAKEDWWLQPVSHWKFDEGDGNTAYDSTGNNDGTLMDEPRWVAGRLGDYALDFDGIDDYVDIPDDPSLRFSQYDSFSISCWTKPSGGYGHIVGKMRAANCSNGIFGYEMYWNDSKSALCFSVEKSCRGYVVVATADNSAPAGSWYHTVAVYDNKDMKIYLNGEFKNSGFFDYDTGSTTPDKNLAIGVRSLESTMEKYFGGKIDDVRIYDRALSAEEIQQLYQEGLQKAYAPAPADGVADVDPNTILSWSPGINALLHDVYFGTDYNDVKNANTGSPEYQGIQDANNWDPNNYDSNGLEPNSTFYWRIDEKTSTGTVEGEIWSFTTWIVFDPNLNLVSWWKLDEVSGLTAADSAGSHPGALTNIIGNEWTSGRIDGALGFDGIDDYVQVGNVIGTWSQGTICAWVKYDSVEWGPAGTFIYCKTGQPLVGGVEAGLGAHPGYSDNDLRFGIYSGLWRWADSNITPSTDQWYHVVGTWGPEGIKVYINGDFKGSNSYTGSMPYANYDAIGAGGQAGSVVDGTIDDVRVYDRALSAGEIQQLYQSGLN